MSLFKNWQIYTKKFNTKPLKWSKNATNTIHYMKGLQWVEISRKIAINFRKFSTGNSKRTALVWLRGRAKPSEFESFYEEVTEP